MSEFRKITGHKNLIAQLEKSIQEKTYSHAYIFYGEQGVGKKLLAETFARGILCSQPNPPCGSCLSCQKSRSKNHIDLRYLQPEKPHSIGVDDIRHQIVDDMQMKPFEDGHKIYIIPDAQNMTPQASNALLKTLEEPPSYGIIILVTDSMDRLLPTIQSRCMGVEVLPLTNEEVESYLVQLEAISREEAKKIALFARGSIGRALRLLANTDFSQLVDRTIRLLKNLPQLPYYELVANVKEFQRDQGQIYDVFDIMTIWFRDVLLFKATANPQKVLFADSLIDIRKQATMSTYGGIETILEGIDKAKDRLKAHASFDQTLDLLFETIKENIN